MPINPQTAVSLNQADALEVVGLNRPIHLPALTHLCPATANVLASANQGIVLRSLKTLTVAAAEALAPHKWGLHLPAVARISREVGNALAKHEGSLEFGVALKALHSPLLASRIAMQSKGHIVLNGLEGLSPEIARALAHRATRCGLMPSVSLNGLRRLTAEAAAELAEAFYMISLRGLSDGQCVLEDGAAEALSAADARCDRVLIDHANTADFLAQNYPPELLAKVVRSLHSPHDDDSCNQLHLGSLTSLSTIQAKAICEFGGNSINLDGLEEIGPDIAGVLKVLWDGHREVFIDPKILTDPGLVSVALRGVFEGDEYWEWAAEVLSPAAAAALASEEAANILRKNLYHDLALPQIRLLNSGVASALATTSLSLRLDGLTHLPTEVAQALARHRGPRLTMNALKTMTAAAAREIVRHRGTLELNGLSSLSPAAQRELGHKITWPS